MANLEDYKGFFQSKAVWGGFFAFLGGVGALGNYTLSAADTASLVDLLTGIPATVGGLLAIYGRVVASKEIGPAPQA